MYTRLSFLFHLQKTVRSSRFEVSQKAHEQLYSIGHLFKRLYFEKGSNHDKNFYEKESLPDGISIDDICNGNTDLEHKLKIIVLEMEVMRQEGLLVPDNNEMKLTHWRDVLTMPTVSARRRYFTYLFKTFRTRENRRRKKIEKQISLGPKPERVPNEKFEDFVHKYDLQHNSMFLRIYDTTINHLYNYRLIQAITFGSKIIFDCGYDSDMVKRENVNCAKQLMLAYANNRLHKDPLDMHLFNCKMDGDLMKYLQKFIGTLHEPWFPIHINECSYLDKFPRDKLVYLTPHCREEMQSFDADRIYIVGAIVDKINQAPLSLAKAKSEGLRMAKFPLDKYLHWSAGSGKSLTVNQSFDILCDLKSSRQMNDWNYALRHVPRRKLKEEKLPDLLQRPSWRPSTTVVSKQTVVRSKSIIRSLYDE